MNIILVMRLIALSLYLISLIGTSLDLWSECISWLLIGIAHIFTATSLILTFLNFLW